MPPAFTWVFVFMMVSFLFRMDLFLFSSTRSSTFSFVMPASQNGDDASLDVRLRLHGVSFQGFESAAGPARSSPRHLPSVL